MSSTITRYVVLPFRSTSAINSTCRCLLICEKWPKKNGLNPGGSWSPGSGWTLNFGNTAITEASSASSTNATSVTRLHRSSSTLNCVTLTLMTMAEAVMMMLPFTSACPVSCVICCWSP